MSKEPEKKDELVRLLSDVDSQARRLETLGQEVVRSARLSRDVVGPIRDFVSRVPAEALSPDQLDRQAESWRLWRVLADEVEASRITVNSFYAASFAASSTSSEAIAMVAFPSPPSPSVRAGIESAKLRLHQTLERFPLIDRARSSMRRLGLDSRGGSYRTPLDLLNEAQGALDHPVFQEGGPVSILIPLRESINSTIAELLRRRTTQEPAAKLTDKLASLGRQCAGPGLQAPHFERLAADAETLLNELSGAKQTDLPRHRQTELFHRGLLFLNALMDSLDEGRLKST